ncbi:MAG: ACT domain-containing protein, partial [Cardiobacteriaceae bacterium]|nr:ACT domain-containing protein [Cardiobacteriaceae bacterium]
PHRPPDHKDRLLFERQKSLAAIFAWQNTPTSSATERFMRHYYRATRRIRRITRLIVKLIESRHLPPETPIPLDEHYCIRARRIDLRHPAPDHFQRHPEQLWPIFTHLQNHPELDGLHPLLARQLYESRDTLITPAFRANPANRHNFLAILRHPGNVYRQIRRLLRYGILHRYIPGYWHIIGRMPYNLFHQYTIDQHTLHLLATLDSFKNDAPAYPHASRIMANLPDRATLYLAAILHDIGKGREGDHSQIRAPLAQQFRPHNPLLPPEDHQRPTILIRHHLLMSDTAQKQDLTDPAVITTFAQTIQTRANLDHLYLLTIADISATNPTLWNNWRATLLSTLYQHTAAQLDHPQPALPRHIEKRKQQTRTHLQTNPDTLWQTLPDTFFSNDTPENIAAKTRDLMNPIQPHRALLLPGTPPQLYIRSSHPPGITFARTTHYLERHNHNIVEARLYQNHNKTLTLQQYTLAHPPADPAQLQTQLSAHLAHNQPPPPPRKRLSPAHLRHFPTATRIRTRQNGNRHTLDITCQDRHGLLSLISRILLQHNISVDHAKITTLGEKAQDIFHLGGQPTPAQLDTLRQALHHALDPPSHNDP